MSLPAISPLLPTDRRTDESIKKTASSAALDPVAAEATVAAAAATVAAAAATVATVRSDGPPRSVCMCIDVAGGTVVAKAV